MLVFENIPINHPDISDSSQDIFGCMIHDEVILFWLTKLTTLAVSASFLMRQRLVDLANAGCDAFPKMGTSMDLVRIESLNKQGLNKALGLDRRTNNILSDLDDLDVAWKKS